MLMVPKGGHESPLKSIEMGMMLLTMAAAFAWPRIGSTGFKWVEQRFARLARRQHLAVLAVGMLALGGRLALLPLFPVPLPFAPDDYSNLLAADTFAHGHLTNPTPDLWQHFESIHIDMKPHYMSMYFPANGLVMAAGKVLAGSAWFGTLLVDALFCAALTWMLQAWLPPGWALLGGLLAVLRLGLFSYWINTYTGAGFITALAGALILGGYPRFQRSGGSMRHGVAMAVGIGMVALARPYEGLLLCLPVLGGLVHWFLKGRNRPAASVLARRALVPALLIAAALGWLGYYNACNYGSATTMPYTVNRATYAMAPYFVWQKPHPEPIYNHASMREFYYECELDDFNRFRGFAGFGFLSLIKVVTTLQFFAGFVLLVPLFMAHRVLRDRRTRFLLLCLALLVAGLSIENFLLPHYVAPFTCVLYALGLQAMRHLRQARPEGRPWGLAAVRMAVLIIVICAGLRVASRPLGLLSSAWPPFVWEGIWFGPEHFGTERPAVENQLLQLPGKQLVLVRYGANHNPFEEWIYNSSDIKDAKVLWAHEMGFADNQKLMEHYPGRTVWVAEPDALPARLTPYTPLAARPQ